MNQSLKRTAMNSSLAAPVISSTTATSTITLSMIMKYEQENVTENATVNHSLSMRDNSEERLFQAVYLGYLWTALIIGLPGNVIIAVVYVVIRQKRTSDWFIFFLSVYDCAVCVFAVPLYLSIETGAWVDSGSDLACKIEQFTIFTAQFSSVCMLGIIAVDRYLKICHPTKRSLNATQARNLGFCTPLVSAFVAAPILVWDGNVERRFCRVQEQYRGTLGVKFHLCLTFGFFLCMFFVVIFCYSHVCVVVRRRIKRHRENALKRRHLMQIPAFLQAISNVDDPLGLGHPGGRNKKRFSLFSIGSSRRLSAISPWIKARLSLPSDGCGRKLVNPEDETELASKGSLVDIKRQLDYALMFRTKTSTIEESYRDAKESIRQESREYKDSFDEINRHDRTQSLHAFPQTSNDKSQVFASGESSCNGVTDKSQTNSNNQSEDSVFERRGGSQVSHLADFHADQGYQPNTDSMIIFNSDSCTNSNKLEGNIVVNKNQNIVIGIVIGDEVRSRTDTDEQSSRRDSEKEESKYDTAYLSQNINEEKASNDDSTFQTRMDGAWVEDDSTASPTGNYCEVNTLCESASPEEICRNVYSECVRFQNECVQIPNVCSSSAKEPIRRALSNKCCANDGQGRSVSGSLSRSLRSLFCRTGNYNFKQSPIKGKVRSKRCRSASSLLSPKHMPQLSRADLSEQVESISWSNSDLRVSQKYISKPDWRWKNCVHKTLSNSTACEEFGHNKKGDCQRLHSKHGIQGKDIDDAGDQSPSIPSPAHVAFSQRGVNQSMRSTLVRDLNYTNLPYSKLIDEVSEPSSERERCHISRPLSYDPSENIHVLIGGDDDDYVDDDGTKALLESSDTNQFAIHNSTILPECRNIANSGIEKADQNSPSVELDSVYDVRSDNDHKSRELHFNDDSFSPLYDDNHVSEHNRDLKKPLQISDKSRNIQSSKRHSEEINHVPYIMFEDCIRKTQPVTCKSEDIPCTQTHIQDPTSRSCSPPTHANQITGDQQFANAVGDINSVITESSNNGLVCGKTFAVSENTSMKAGDNKISDASENVPGRLNLLGGQSKQTPLKNKCVFHRCTHNVCSTVRECGDASSQNALDKDVKHGVRAAEFSCCERVDTRHTSELTTDNYTVMPHTYNQDEVQTRFQTNKQEHGHDNNSNDDTGVSYFAGLSSVLTSAVSSENNTCSFGSSDNNVLFKDTKEVDKDGQLLDIEESAGRSSMGSTDCALNDWESILNSSDFIEKQLVLMDHSSKMEAQDGGNRCHCGQIFQSDKQIKPDKDVSEIAIDGSRDTKLKQNKYNPSLGKSTPATLNIHYDGRSCSGESILLEESRSQSLTQDVDFISRTEANSGNFNQILPYFEELRAGNCSPDIYSDVQSSDLLDKPNTLGLVGYHHCPTYMSLDSEPFSECNSVVEPCQTSNRFSMKEDAQVTNEQNQVQHDNDIDSPKKEDTLKTASEFNNLHQPRPCAYSEDLQPLTIDILNQYPSVDTHHHPCGGTITNDSSCQRAISISSSCKQTAESCPQLHGISERLSATADKVSEFDFSHCDECLLVSFIDFLPENKISLVAQTIAVLLRNRLANSIHGLVPFLSCTSQTQNDCCTTAPSSSLYNYDTFTLSSIPFSTNRSLQFHRLYGVRDISDPANFHLSPEGTSLTNYTAEYLYNHSQNNPDVLNQLLESDMLEVDSTFESCVDSQMSDNHCTIDPYTSLNDNTNTKSCMIDSTTTMWIPARDKPTPFFTSSNVYYHDHFCHCKYFWSRFLKDLFNKEMCPFCLKPVNYSGFSIFSHSHPSRMLLNYTDKGTFEKWLCRTQLDRLSQKSMREDECQILVYDAGAQNKGNGVLCCSYLVAMLQDIGGSDLVFRRNLSKLGNQSDPRFDVFELPTPVWSYGGVCKDANMTFDKNEDENESSSSVDDKSFKNDCSCTNQRVGDSLIEIPPSMTVTVGKTVQTTSVLRNYPEESSLLCSDPGDAHVLSCLKHSNENQIPYREIINDKQIGNESEEIEKRPRCKPMLPDDVHDSRDYSSEEAYVSMSDNAQNQSSMKGVQIVHEANQSQSSPLEKSKLISESFLLHPKNNMRQFKLSSSNIVNCALNSLVPLAVGSAKQELDIPSSVHDTAELHPPENSSKMTSATCCQNITSQDIEISSSTSENDDKTIVLPGTTKTIHSALLGCVPTFQVDDFEINSSLQDLNPPQRETCQFFVRTVFDTFFTSNSYPFKSDPCLSASDIDYANSELLVFPLSPLFCRTTHHQKDNNENPDDTQVYHIADRKRQRLNSAFDIYDARIRKIRSPKRNGPTQSWYSLDDLSSKATNSRHASMVFLASLRRQLNNVLSPKSIRQFFGINNPQDSKASGRRPPCPRDTLSTNQINVIITRCDSLVMDKRQEMGLPPIRDRAATLDPASLEKSTRSTYDSSLSNMSTNTAYDTQPKPRASSLDTSYSSNSHSDDPSLLCRSQDLSIGRSRMASLDLLSPTSASYRTGSMCSGISSLSKLTECSAYTEHSRSDCEKITRRTAEREHNITKLLGVITLVFVCSWSVSWSIILIDNLTVFPVTDMLATNVILSIARNLFLVNHFCNILVYMVLSRSFRDKMSECYSSCTSCFRV